MTITTEEFSLWLLSQDSTRCVLVEVVVGLAAGGTTTRYLSSKPFVTNATDTPSNTVYIPRIKDGLSYTRSLDMSGNVSLSFGDLALTNIDGALDTWVDDFWVNRPMSVYLGDVTWSRADYRLVFTGLTLGLDMQDRNTFNIQISDNTQRLNTPVSEATLGGTTALDNTLLPLVFGECHNISPVVTDASINEYIVHNGQVENIIEVRDNGIPVSFTEVPATGRFTLANQPYGTITCSVQGAVVPASFLLSTDALSDTTVWARTGMTSVTTIVGGTGGSAGPYSGTDQTVVISDSSGSNYIDTLLTGLTPGTSYTTSIFVKAGVASTVVLQTWADSFVGLQGVSLNLSTGVASLVTDPTLLAHAGVTDHFGAVPVGNGWYRVWVAGYNTSDANVKRIRILVPTGNGSSVQCYLAGAQCELGSYPTSYWNGSQALGVPVYRNTVAEMVKLLAMSYGDTRLQFSLDEIDIPTFVKFDCQNRQAVGVFLNSRANVLDTCTQIAASVGARVTISRDNKLTLVKLDLPQATTGTAITGADMTEKSISISSMPPVVASVRLGYCRNWTVQTTVAGGLDSNSSALFAKEWLTITRTDSLAAANYKLFTDPVEEDTLLIVGAEATAEANRRLNMFNTQRKVISYSGYYHLIFEELGAPQTLTNPRFGLSGGVTGQIISIAVDFTSPHIAFKVLI